MNIKVIKSSGPKTPGTTRSRRLVTPPVAFRFFGWSGHKRRKMTEDQRVTLSRRVQDVGRQQPEILTLRAKLLGIGGAEIVALPLTMGIDPFVPLLEIWGQVMKRPVTYRRMEPSQCHLNVARLWSEKKKGSRLIGVGTGYALSDDGLWYGHSWGLNKKGDHRDYCQPREIFWPSLGWKGC